MNITPSLINKFKDTTVITMIILKINIIILVLYHFISRLHKTWVCHTIHIISNKYIVKVTICRNGNNIEHLELCEQVTEFLTIN